MKVFALTILVLTFLPAFAQTKIEEGWNGLLPLKSTKADVEKITGKGVAIKEFWPDDPKHHRRYNTDDAFIEAYYSAPPCDEISFYQLDVPEYTLLEISVELKQLRPITDFTFDKNRFERQEYRKREHFGDFYYTQWEKSLLELPNQWIAGFGMSFTGDIIEGREYLKFFEYERPYGERGKHDCKKATPTAGGSLL